MQFSVDNISKKILAGLSWDVGRSDSPSGAMPNVHDVDLSCALISKEGHVIDMITPQDPKRDVYRAIVQHSGDHHSGGSDFEDEDLQVWLDKVPENIQAISFFVSVKGATHLNQVEGIQFTILDGITLEQFCFTDLAMIKPVESSDHMQAYYGTFLVQRDGAGDWDLLPHGNYFRDMTALELDLAKVMAS